jgi:hypothetical protein
MHSYHLIVGMVEFRNFTAIKATIINTPLKETKS